MLGPGASAPSQEPLSRGSGGMAIEELFTRGRLSLAASASMPVVPAGGINLFVDPAGGSSGGGGRGSGAPWQGTMRPGQLGRR